MPYGWSLPSGMGPSGMGPPRAAARMRWMPRRSRVTRAAGVTPAGVGQADRDLG